MITARPATGFKLAFALILSAFAAAPAAAQAHGAFSALQLSAPRGYAPVFAPVSSPAPVKYNSNLRGAADIGVRLRAVSDRFLGIPYVLGPLGEGAQGEFDRGPLVSFTGLDCTTFVEETLAFTLGADDAGALDTLRRIRYKDGRIAYEARNHFPEVDWLPNNIAAGFLKDITAQVGGSGTGTVRKIISKRAWYQGKTEADLKGFEAEPAEQRRARLERLRAAGAGFADQEAAIQYVPLSLLPGLLPAIPSGTVVSLVRESRPDKPTVVTHQFFIFDGPYGKIIRHAALGKQVMDVPAAEYIANLATYTSWKVLGFNLAAVVK
ncbi:MAG TPA: DUF1460 domain-containing protein [Elusimicrobiales bacterium]|nr:DUF1460 domain-containing protein [Elusimicrobiales bacterium]